MAFESLEKKLFEGTNVRPPFDIIIQLQEEISAPLYIDSYTITAQQKIKLKEANLKELKKMKINEPMKFARNFDIMTRISKIEELEYPDWFLKHKKLKQKL